MVFIDSGATTMQSRVSKGRKTVCFRAGGSTSGGFVVGGVAGSMLANCEAMLMEFKCERVRVND